MMKKIILLAGYSLLFAGPIGCDGPQPQPPINDSAAVVNRTNKDFPAFLVGTWKGDKLGWKFVFSPDGTIASAVIEFARMHIKPNQISTTTGRGGQPGLFEVGDCDVAYDTDTRTLNADVRLNRVYIDMNENVLQGTLEYYFTGEVTPEEKIWVATKFTTMNIGVYRKDPNTLPPAEPKLIKWSDFITDPSEEVDVVTFTKVGVVSNDKISP